MNLNLKEAPLQKTGNIIQTNKNFSRNNSCDKLRKKKSNKIYNNMESDILYERQNIHENPNSNNIIKENV